MSSRTAPFAKICGYPGCYALTHDGTSRCPRHPRKAWARAAKASETTSERGYGWQWQKLRKQILQRDVLCQPCLAKIPERITLGTEVDHIVPKSQGGTDDPANLCAICADCHREKTQRESNAT